MGNSPLFSDQLSAWFGNPGRKTLNSLVEVFEEKSFAASLLLLMLIPALPLPTGGITHVFEVIAVLITLEMILGKTEIWLPGRWRGINFAPKAGPRTEKLIDKIRWLEARSKPRLKPLIKNGLFIRITGLVMMVFCLTAFLAPPFSGLDTLPSLGVVLIALSMLFEDVYIYILGLVSGIAGITTVLVLGTVIFKSMRLLF